MEVGGFCAKKLPGFSFNASVLAGRAGMLGGFFQSPPVLGHSKGRSLRTALFRRRGIIFSLETLFASVGIDRTGGSYRMKKDDEMLVRFGTNKAPDDAQFGMHDFILS